MTSGRHYNDKSDKSFEQELERYSRERTHRREDSYSKRDNLLEQKSKESREALEKKSAKSTRYFFLSLVMLMFFIVTWNAH